MQQLRLHKKLYQLGKIDEAEYSKTVYKRLEVLDKFDRLRNEGCSEKTALEVLGISRATYYRWHKNYDLLGLSGLEPESRRPHKVRKFSWTSETEDRIFKLRKDYPLWGKYKISVMYKRRFGTSISVSTVGRIIVKLLKQNKIKSVRFLTGRSETKPRVFDNHAQRWQYDMKAKMPGELIQIDHMCARLYTGVMVRHFKAICPVTRISHEQVYWQATSKNAAQFLSYIRQQFPFTLISIQVDGGSEFMGEFEQTCKKYGIKLFVLPPRSPEYNGRIERSNSTVKREFYTQYAGLATLEAVQQALEKFGDFYNKVRPHQALQYLTPWQAYQQYNAGALQSHMS
jgi:putative transposase